MRPATAVTAAFLALAGARTATAQSLRWVDHTGHYGAISFVHHALTITCDSLCGGSQPGSAFAISLGRQVTRRVRFEVSADLGITTDKRSTFFSAGLASYLVGGLHVRGAATYASLDITDTTREFTYRGGPGFLVGAGFDLPIGRTWAATPFVNYTSATAKSITVNPGTTTAGRFHSLNFGLSLTRLAGMYQCTNNRGEKVWARPRDRTRALACLREVESRASGSTGKIKL